jgi:hypothetical protein
MYWNPKPNFHRHSHDNEAWVEVPVSNFDQIEFVCLAVAINRDVSVGVATEELHAVLYSAEARDLSLLLRIPDRL